MTAATTAPDRNWTDEVSRLARDAALAPFIVREHPVMLFDAEGRQLLHATPAADPIAREGFSPTSQKRIAALADGLAPASGLRLERLQLSGAMHDAASGASGESAATLTMVCRRIRLSDGAGALFISALAPMPVDAKPVSPTETQQALLEDRTGNAAAPALPANSDAAAAAPSPAPRMRDRVRLIWETSPTGELRLISPEARDVVGETGVAAMAGRRLQALIGPRIADPDGALTAALAQTRTWSGVETIWRVEDAEDGVRVVMSGLPAGPAGGLRGFAVAHAGRVSPAAPFTAAGDDMPASAEDVGQPETAPPEPAPEAPAGPAPARTAEAPEAPPLFHPARTGVVTPIRPDDPPPRPSLTRNERNAFREIARALGARLEGDHDEPPASPALTAVPPEAPEETREDAADEVSDDAALGPDPAIDLEAASGLAEGPSEEPADQPAVEPAEPTSSDAAAEASAPASEEAAEAVSASIIRLNPPAPPREDAFADLIDKLPIGVLVMKAETCVYANRTLLDLLDHDDLDSLNAAGADGLFEDAAPSEGGGVFRLVRRDGGHEPVDARLAAISWHGEPATLISFRRALDTVDAARLEAAKLDAGKAQSQARELSAILDTATDGVITLDDRGRILSLNRSAEALFGYDQREVIGENFTLLLAPEAHITALDYLEGLKGGGVASLLNDGREVQGRVRQGGRIPLFMTMGRVSDGEDRKYSAVLRDMTAWKRAEADLVDARRFAERASEQKSDVLAKISHEIRTPLNAIIGFTEVMSEERFGPVGNERYKGYLQDIQQSGTYLLSLINDLLDLAKIEAGRMDLTFTGVSINDVAGAAVALLQPEANRQRVVLRTGLQPRLPHVVADERSLRQIVINVLSNAVKFTDPGGQVILSTALGDKGEVVLRVRDTGIGMTDKELAQAMEPFRQVSATRRGQGTGLGLPITKALVEANKGALAISSAKNEGTLVEITFPPQRVLAS